MKTRPASCDEKKFNVVSLGIMAQRALSCSRKWQVLSTYERSLYCRDEIGNIICVGSNEIGKGAFTLICSSSTWWPKEQLRDIRYFEVVENKLIPEGSSFYFDMGCATIWQESLHELDPTDRYIEEDLRWLVRRAAASAPQESFGRLIPAFFSGESTDVTSIAGVTTFFLLKRILEVAQRINDNFISAAEDLTGAGVTGGLERLIGLGHGLTPSGDDFLAGFVMGLHKMQKHDDAGILAERLYRRAQGKTTTISLSFYRALAEGWASEPYWHLLEAIGHGKMARRHQLFDRITKIGGTSGWDTLAGIVFGTGLVLRSSSKFKGCRAEAVC